MRAIVTGASGFIGSHVAEYLAKSGHCVLGIDDLSGSNRDTIPEGIEFEVADCQQDITHLLQKFKPDYVYHLAAYAAEGLSHHIPAFNYENNLVATARLLTSCFHTAVKQFIFTSSIATYGHPESTVPFTEHTPCQPCDPYGVAKYACELHIKAFQHYHGGPDFTVFRPHNVFGPRQNISDPYRNVVGIFMRCALEGVEMPIFGTGEQTRSFSYIDSVAQCIAMAPFTPQAKNATFNVGGDESLTVLELARRISGVMGVEERIKYLPARDEVMHAHCNHALVRSVFSDAFSKQITVNEGLRQMAKYVKSHPIPATTECPSQIEIHHNLPTSWADRLMLADAKL